MDHRRLAARLAAFEEVRFAVLLGSPVGEAARRDSGMDIAVYLSPELTPAKRWSTRLRLQTDLADLGDVDLVVLNDAPPLLAHRALLGRRILMRDRAAYVRFFVRAIAAAEDERPYRELHRRARLRRLEERRFGRP